MTAPAADTPTLHPPALRNARRRAGLSLDAVGERIGRAGSIVARYERGIIDPPASALTALARLYRVHPGDFWTSGPCPLP